MNGRRYQRHPMSLQLAEQQLYDLYDLASQLAPGVALKAYSALPKEKAVETKPARPKLVVEPMEEKQMDFKYKVILFNPESRNYYPNA